MLIDIMITLGEDYNPTASDFDDIWQDAYTGVIRSCLEIEQNAIASESFVMVGSSKIPRAQVGGIFASLFETIPFSEAGLNDESKFDDQLEVYAAAQILLDDAIADINEGGSSPGSADLFYQGDATKWKELTYSLKARFTFMRENMI